MNWVCADGKMVKESEPVLTVSNRSFRYGDGLFETMRVVSGKIRLELYHMERLFTGLTLLGINPSTLSEESIQSNITELLEANKCKDSARVRLTIFRNDNDSAGYVVEAGSLEKKMRRDWSIDIYPYARRTADAFSHLKSTNYLSYVLAGKYAEKNMMDEVLLLNHEGRIPDGSKTNVFLVHNSRVSTPALHQGCVAGVMRRHVISELKSNDIGVHQVAISEEHLLEADEVFLTNAIIGIQPVKQFRQKTYTQEFIKDVRAICGVS